MDFSKKVIKYHIQPYQAEGNHYRVVTNFLICKNKQKIDWYIVEMKDKFMGFYFIGTSFLEEMEREKNNFIIHNYTSLLKYFSIMN